MIIRLDKTKTVDSWEQGGRYGIAYNIDDKTWCNYVKARNEFLNATFDLEFEITHHAHPD